MEQISWDHVQESIAAADDFHLLRAIREQAHDVFRDRLFFHDFVESYAELNRLHDSLIHRAVQLAVRSLAERGHSKPALAFAFLLFGSGGRQEQTLWSDQDNGLVYEDPRDEAEALEAYAYFSELSEEIHNALLIIGYPPCSGEVLARNPMWRKGYSEYAHMIRVWMKERGWENIRYLLIFADIRAVYGQAELAEQLKRELLDYTASHPDLLHEMLRNTLHHKVSVGVFGQLITERYGEDAGSFDIKYGAYIPLVNGVRLLAVKAGIAAVSTLGRIGQLRDIGWIGVELFAEWELAVIAALKLRAMTPFRMEAGLYSTSGKLPLARLPKQLRQQLKQCLRTGRRLHKFVSEAVRRGKA